MFYLRWGGYGMNGSNIKKIQSVMFITEAYRQALLVHTVSKSFKHQWTQQQQNKNNFNHVADSVYVLEIVIV